MNYLEQLNSILKASGWSQEQLARELDTSFQTLNSWINQRSMPRQKAIQKIELLYLTIVGSEAVDEAKLAATKKAAIQLVMNPQELVISKKNLDKLTLYLTYHTNTIEGSTMTLSDVENVIFEHGILSNRTAVEQAEARNHQAALHWLLDEIVKSKDSFVINEQLILGIHLRLMNGIISDAGQYRRHAVRIMGAHVPLANWLKIPELMQVFIANISRQSDDIIARMARTHAEFERIHPFSDGNGRTGRLILLAQALQANLTPPLVVKERKNAYYKYLELAQTRGQHQPLELFIAQSMQFCYELLKK